MPQEAFAEPHERLQSRGDAGGRPFLQVVLGFSLRLVLVEGDYLLLQEVRRIHVVVRLLESGDPRPAPVVEVDVGLEQEEPAALQVEVHHLVGLSVVFRAPQLLQRVTGVLEHVELVRDDGGVRKELPDRALVDAPEVACDDFHAFAPLLPLRLEERIDGLPVPALEHVDHAFARVVVEDGRVDMALADRDLVDAEDLAGPVRRDQLALGEELLVDAAHGLVVQPVVAGHGGDARVVAFRGEIGPEPVGLPRMRRQPRDLLDVHLPTVRTADAHRREAPEEAVRPERDVLDAPPRHRIVGEEAGLPAVHARVRRPVPALEVDEHIPLVRLGVADVVLGQLISLYEFDNLILRHVGSFL